MNRPRVVLVARRMVRKSKTIDWVSEVHLSLVLRQGLLPVVVPIVPETRAVLPLYAEKMAGLLLVEGGDIQPSYYGRRAGKHDLEELDPVKDSVEFWLCRRALAAGVPILGICRGMQLLNVIRGGSLYFDVRKEKRSSLFHVAGPARYDSYRHPVEVIPGTPLVRWYGRGKLTVNSYHHQGVKDLAPGLKPMAVAPDGLVEAFYDPRHRFLVGLQFHPERMYREHSGNRRVFEAFGRAVRSGRR
jgi:gamma-glutamyl-gamma-aminobutyrate hydrolase PuuD